MTTQPDTCPACGIPLTPDGTCSAGDPIHEPQLFTTFPRLTLTTDKHTATVGFLSEPVGSRGFRWAWQITDDHGHTIDEGNDDYTTRYDLADALATLGSFLDAFIEARTYGGPDSDNYDLLNFDPDNWPDLDDLALALRDLDPDY